MTYPENYRYTKDHEWVSIDGDTATIGISSFAQSELGEVVFVELPEVGTKVVQGKTLCVVESTKAASDVYAPVGGVVTAVNTALLEDPADLNNDPHQKGWLVKLGGVDVAELEKLMDAAAYSSHVD